MCRKLLSYDQLYVEAVSKDICSHIMELLTTIKLKIYIFYKKKLEQEFPSSEARF